MIAGEEAVDFYDLLLLVTSLAAGLAITGGLILIPARQQRRVGWQLLQLGLLVDLLFNEFSTFRDQQFGALTLFIPELLMMLAIRHLLRQDTAGRPVGRGRAHRDARTTEAAGGR